MLKPIRDNIVLELIQQETTTAGGIVIPGAALEKPHRGLVVACNEQFVMPDGSVKQCEVAVGDIVLFGKTHGTDVKHEGTTYRIVAEEFILCKE